MNGAALRRNGDAGGALRVLVASTSPEVWGAERSLLGLAPLLEERGIRLSLASPRGGFSDAWSALGLPHVEFAVPSRSGLRATGGGRPGVRELAGEVASTGRSARRLAQLAREVDVVHSNSLWGHLDCAVAGRISGRPVVLELHDLVRPGLGRIVLRMAVRLASSDRYENQAFRYGDRVYGLQFHLEGDDEVAADWAADLPAGISLDGPARRPVEATGRRVFGRFIALGSATTRTPKV